MLNTIKLLLESKKALVMLVSLLVWAGGKLGLHLDNDTLLGAVTPLWVFILGQGIADHGKEAAKVIGANAAAQDARGGAPLGKQGGFIGRQVMLGLALFALAGGACMISFGGCSAADKNAEHAALSTASACAKQDIWQPVKVAGVADAVALVTAVTQGLAHGAGMTALDDGAAQAKADIGQLRSSLGSTLEQAAVDCAIKAAVAAYVPLATGKGFAGGDARITAIATIGQRLLIERGAAP